MRFKPGLKSEWLIIDEKSGESTEEDDVIVTERGESGIERLGRSWRREMGSLFQRQDEGYGKEWSVIRNEDNVGGRAGMTYDNRMNRWWRAGAARKLNRDEVMQVRTLSACEDFACEGCNQCMSCRTSNHLIEGSAYSKFCSLSFRDKYYTSFSPYAFNK